MPAPILLFAVLGGLFLAAESSATPVGMGSGGGGGTGGSFCDQAVARLQSFDHDLAVELASHIVHETDPATLRTFASTLEGMASASPDPNFRSALLMGASCLRTKADGLDIPPVGDKGGGLGLPGSMTCDQAVAALDAAGLAPGLSQALQLATVSDVIKLRAISMGLRSAIPAAPTPLAKMAFSKAADCVDARANQLEGKGGIGGTGFPFPIPGGFEMTPPTFMVAPPDEGKSL